MPSSELHWALTRETPGVIYLGDMAIGRLPIVLISVSVIKHSDQRKGGRFICAHRSS